jgi:hypothetical protein
VRRLERKAAGGMKGSFLLPTGVVWGKTHLLRLHRGGFLCLVCLTLRRERREPGKPQPVHPHRGRSGSDGTGGRIPTLLETLPAKYRSSLSRLERHGGFPTTLGTLDGGFHPFMASSESLLAATLARVTSFGLVPETLVREKGLLAGCKTKLCAAIDAIQNPVPIFHGLPPLFGTAKFGSMLRPLDNHTRQRLVHKPARNRFT